MYLRFTNGDRAYIKSHFSGPLPNFKNKVTVVRSVTVLETVTRYVTDLGEFDSDDLLSTEEQQAALEADKSLYVQQLQQRLKSLLGN